MYPPSDAFVDLAFHLQGKEASTERKSWEAVRNFDFKIQNCAQDNVGSEAVGRICKENFELLNSGK